MAIDVVGRSMECGRGETHPTKRKEKGKGKEQVSSTKKASRRGSLAFYERRGWEKLAQRKRVTGRGARGAHTGKCRGKGESARRDKVSEQDVLTPWIKGTDQDIKTSEHS
jgi:hypothetical protein